jgi:hypothetical protein
MKLLWRGKYVEYSELINDPEYVKAQQEQHNRDRELMQNLCKGLKELRGHEDEPA